MSRESQARRVIATNRRARHEFLILEEVEAGLVLTGSEVKSLRQGRASLQEAYARIKGGEAWLVGLHIPEYAPAAKLGHEPVHDRRLLLHRRQIEKWLKQAKEKGTTIVPLELYFAGHLVKVQLALVRGKKLHDKRHAQAEREAKRQIERAMGRRR
jgi:SsrA-binding protein